jgi:hypothetical protein
MSVAPVVAPAPAPGWLDRPGWWLALCAAVYLPFTVLGFGTDVDVPNVLRSGRALVDGGRYEMSRGPGAVVHEVSTGVLDRVGGSVLVNLASVGFALLSLWCVQALLRAESARWPVLAMLVLASNPWFWIAATSLGDFTWALGLVLAGAVVSGRRRPIPAGVLFALAIGCRASSALLVLAWLVAQRTGDADRRPPMAETMRTAGVAVVLGALCFVPPWLAADRTADFLDNQLDFAGVGVHLGRALTKNAAVVGVLAALVLLSGVVRIARDGIGRWSSSLVVRFAVLMIVLTELLFLRFPFKPLHLLPVVAGVALLIGSTRTIGRRWIAALIVAQLVGGLIGSTIASPDVIDDARTGRLELGVTAGPLLTDVRCRLDDRETGEWQHLGSLDAAIRGAQNAACQSKSWRAESEP